MEFNRNAIQPMDCYRAVWALVKPRYGLMLGICLVCLLISACGPFGLLLGPMMCGLFICYLRLQRGETIEFNTLFRGFDHFGPGFAVAFIQVLPVMLIHIPYLVWLMWFFTTQAFAAPRTGDPLANNPLFSSTYWIGFAIDFVALTVVGGIMHGLFVFGYGLVVERQMKGLDAIKLSARAALANLGGIAALVVINILLGFAGLLVFCVGGFLLIPITWGVWTVAYRRVFPEPAADATV